jgi:mannose-6-phosphate isomerase-like protein (cupin superfamily)
MTYYVERSGQSTFNYANLHGGSGEIAVQRLFGKKHSWNIDLDIWEIPPGTSEGSHIHDGSDLEYGFMDEIYLILEGHAEMTIDGKIELLNEGDSVLCKAGSDHNLVNIGTKNLKVLLISDPDAESHGD